MGGGLYPPSAARPAILFKTVQEPRKLASESQPPPLGLAVQTCLTKHTGLLEAHHESMVFANGGAAAPPARSHQAWTVVTEGPSHKLPQPRLRKKKRSCKGRRCLFSA